VKRSLWGGRILRQRLGDVSVPDEFRGLGGESGYFLVVEMLSQGPRQFSCS
jgi:hypothetical protein